MGAVAKSFSPIVSTPIDKIFWKSLADVKNFCELCSQVVHDGGVLVLLLDTTKLLKINALYDFL